MNRITLLMEVERIRPRYLWHSIDSLRREFCTVGPTNPMKRDALPGSVTDVTIET